MSTLTPLDIMKLERAQAKRDRRAAKNLLHAARQDPNARRRFIEGTVDRFVARYGADLDALARS